MMRSVWLLVWLLVGGVAPGVAWGQKRVCKGLQKEADVLLKRAVHFHKRKGRLVLRCKGRADAAKALALYRAFVALRCGGLVYARYGMGLLYHGCYRRIAQACRNYRQYILGCLKDRACQRTRAFRDKLIEQLLPVDAESVEEDRDKDRFVSCYRSRIVCQIGANLEVRREGRRKGLKGPCDCDDEDARVYPGAQEVCDGVDNDCDGKVDEMKDLNAPLCARQEGSCRGARKRCGGKGGWRACTPGDYKKHNATFEPSEESCDGVDNDCDGKVDKGLKAPLCSRQGGFCRGMVKTCAGKLGWQDCKEADYKRRNGLFEAQEKRCDGVDNDCDGKVDNELDAPLCDKQKGLCVGARKRCGGKEGWRECVARDYEKHNSSFRRFEKRCDGVDNDCDGQVDEGCMPLYPWIIGGVGGVAALVGGLVRLNVSVSPQEVAKLERPERPSAQETRNWLAFGDTAMVLGGLVALAGVGLGVGFLVSGWLGRMRDQKARDATPPPPGKEKRLGCFPAPLKSGFCEGIVF